MNLSSIYRERYLPILTKEVNLKEVLVEKANFGIILEKEAKDLKLLIWLKTIMKHLAFLKVQQLIPALIEQILSL